MVSVIPQFPLISFTDNLWKEHLKNQRQQGFCSVEELVFLHSTNSQSMSETQQNKQLIQAKEDLEKSKVLSTKIKKFAQKERQSLEELKNSYKKISFSVLHPPLSFIELKSLSTPLMQLEENYQKVKKELEKNEKDFNEIQQVQKETRHQQLRIEEQLCLLKKAHLLNQNLFDNYRLDIDSGKQGLDRLMPLLIEREKKQSEIQKKTQVLSNKVTRYKKVFEKFTSDLTAQKETYSRWPFFDFNSKALGNIKEEFTKKFSDCQEWIEQTGVPYLVKQAKKTLFFSYYFFKHLENKVVKISLIIFASYILFHRVPPSVSLPLIGLSYLFFSRNDPLNFFKKL